VRLLFRDVCGSPCVSCHWLVTTGHQDDKTPTMLDMVRIVNPDIESMQRIHRDEGPSRYPSIDSTPLHRAQAATSANAAMAIIFCLGGGPWPLQPYRTGSLLLCLWVSSSLPSYFACGADLAFADCSLYCSIPQLLKVFLAPPALLPFPPAACSFFAPFKLISDPFRGVPRGDSAHRSLAELVKAAPSIHFTTRSFFAKPPAAASSFQPPRLANRGCHQLPNTSIINNGPPQPQASDLASKSG
jgi:hypothetical protein